MRDETGATAAEYALIGVILIMALWAAYFAWVAP
jgi:Flp pilus assembly pilin Flp